MKFFRLILCVIFLCVATGTFASEDPDILIYSNSHGPDSFTMKRSGILQIGITSINPIVKIMINDAPIEVSKDSRIDINHPFDLQPGENKFRVRVVTDIGEWEKIFTITFGKKPKPKKPAFQLIGIVGLSSLDNVTSATDDGTKQSGSKTTLTVVPVFRLLGGQDSEFNVKGILMREKFSKEDFKANEISYTQLAVQWKLKNTFMDEIRAETGMNDIRTDNENPLIGKDETISEIFLSGMMKQKIGGKDSWNLKLEFMMKDSKAEVTDPDVDADAAVTSIKGGLNLGFGGLRSTVNARYEINDAKGQYLDSTIMGVGLKVKYPFGDLVPSLGYRVKIKTYAVENPSVGNLKQEDVSSTASVKIGYKLLKKGQLALEAKNKTQTSNVETSEFGATTTTLSFTYVF